MESKLISFLDESGESGEFTLSQLAPQFYKKLHLARQNEIVKQHKIAEGNVYECPKGDGTIKQGP